MQNRRASAQSEKKESFHKGMSQWFSKVQNTLHSSNDTGVLKNCYLFQCSIFCSLWWTVFQAITIISLLSKRRKNAKANCSSEKQANYIENRKQAFETSVHSLILHTFDSREFVMLSKFQRLATNAFVCALFCCALITFNTWVAISVFFFENWKVF